ncbi:MAG: DUF84 family protein [Candidatus Colwellbacteria bacterium]|nr:DUF84 family protein [Candidatus Colwellbacteria bacterium]
MEKMKIAFGSVSEQKIGYLKEVIEDMGMEAEIIAVKAESGIAEQPMTSDETKNGSVNRARYAINNAKGSDCGMGVEIGYHPLENDKYEIFCWATLVAKDNVCVSQRSHGLMMPEFYQKKLKEGEDLHNHVMEYFKLNTDPVTQYVAEIIRGRKPFIIQAIRDALIFYFKKGEFE